MKDGRVNSVVVPPCGDVICCLGRLPVRFPVDILGGKGRAGRPVRGFQFCLGTEPVGKLLGMFLDQRYLSAPVIQSPISDNGEITGQFTQDQTIVLANNLNAGALPVGIEIIENESIGPTLGKIDLSMSLRASE